MERRDQVQTSRCISSGGSHGSQKWRRVLQHSTTGKRYTAFNIWAWPLHKKSCTVYRSDECDHSRLAYECSFLKVGSVSSHLKIQHSDMFLMPYAVILLEVFLLIFTQPISVPTNECHFSLSLSLSNTHTHTHTCTHTHMHAQKASHLHCRLGLLTTQPRMHLLLVSFVCVCVHVWVWLQYDNVTRD